MMRSILLVSSLLLATAAQGGAAQDDDAEWATATLFDCAVESTGDGSFHETCAVESADTRLARRMHPARMVAQPSRPDRRVEGDAGYSTAANIARVVFPLIVFALVVAGAGISLLKGHWWMGLLGALGFGVYALWSTQVSLDIDVLGRFEENVENNIGLAIFIASSAGALLLLLGAVLPARSGSWWDRNRTTQPVSD